MGENTGEYASDFVNLSEAARLLGRDRQTIRRWLNSGRLDGGLDGRTVRVSAIEELLAEGASRDGQSVAVAATISERSKVELELLRAEVDRLRGEVEAASKEELRLRDLVARSDEEAVASRERAVIAEGRLVRSEAETVQAVAERNLERVRGDQALELVDALRVEALGRVLEVERLKGQRRRRFRRADKGSDS